MTIKLTLFLIFGVLISGCTGNRSLHEHINDIYTDRGVVISPDVEVCIVIPEVGCSGCIAGGMYHVISNRERYSVNQQKFIVVFTGINSMKMLRRDLEPISIKDLNCIVDTTNLYLLDDNTGIYPMILKCDNGKVIEAQVQSPDSPTDVFMELENSEQFINPL